MASSPNARGWTPPGAGFNGSFVRLAIGPRWHWTDSMYLRGAFVADWYSGARGTAGGLPFDAGRRSNQQFFVFDIVNMF